VPSSAAERPWAEAEVGRLRELRLVARGRRGRLRDRRRWKGTRIRLGLSQDEVARSAELTRNFVSAIERGAQGLDAWRLGKLADALGVSLCWLLGRPDDPGR
jgi:DNA-binding XRE family transcriptional regulator